MTKPQYRVRVDTDLCIGAGQCELLEPNTFFLSDDDGLARVHEDSELSQEDAHAVVEQCPSGAIRIENVNEDDG